MPKETITYQADGLNMVSELYLPDGAVTGRPGVIVFPEAFGLGAHAKSRAEKLAKLGYVALAADCLGDQKILSGMEEVMAVLGPLLQAPDKIRARAKGALNALAARKEVDPKRIAATGYCFGGTTALELARGGEDIQAVVGFHSGLGSAAPATSAVKVKPRILVCIGADDPMIPPEQRQAFEEEMRGANANWQMHLYGGVVHSFTNPEADQIGNPAALRYDATADANSWSAMLELFDETIKA